MAFVNYQFEKRKRDLEKKQKQEAKRLRKAQRKQGQSAEPREFVIARVFEAPRELVWQAWTQRERLMQWCSPKGYTMSAATLELRPGGVFHYCLRSPEGQEMWGKCVYREIAAPERIVLVNSFSDAQGALTRHPMSPTWPLQMLSTTTLAEQGGQTTLTVQWAPLDATEEECSTFDAGHDSMRMGWIGTLDQLADYLARATQGQ